MSLVGNGIKSEETGKSSITRAFTSLFLGIRAIQIKGNWGKGDFVNRSTLKQSQAFTYQLQQLENAKIEVAPKKLLREVPLMCHNYLGDMYLCIFGEKPAPDTVPSYGYTTKKCLFKQITRPLLFCIDLFCKTSPTCTHDTLLNYLALFTR